MSPANPLRLAILGCGGRGQTYASLASRASRRYCVTAACDPDPVRRSRVRAVASEDGFREFEDAEALFASPRCADVLVVATQDAFHREHAIRGMDCGYDLLLEKPIGPTSEDVEAIVGVARRLNRRVLVCHVLRYTAFYRKIKDILASGLLGEIVSLNATEGVGAWHQAHSFVRGHWSVVEKSSPMILAKSCHDLDIIRWLVDRPCLHVSSHGALTHFREANAPEGAPERCTDGCPVASTCHYNAERYTDQHRNWLGYVMNIGSATTREEILDWLKVSPWGRCVYRCDNTAVDHQTVQMRFEGEVTATFTMTAFENGRHLEVFGTKGRLRAGEFVKRATGADIVFDALDGQGAQSWNVMVPGGGSYAGHGGGDFGLIDALDSEMRKPSPDEMHSSIEVSLESHLMAFAAERSRAEDRMVQICERE